jgi:branched-subunit amino acid transport protein
VTLWLIILAGGAGTVAIRLSVFALIPHTVLPRAARDALRFVTPAVLAGIILPAVLYAGDHGAFDAGPGNDRLVAAIAASAVALVLRNVWLTIGTGMAMLWLLKWVGG